MWRQQIGEDLNVAAVLAWGPSWYHQKTFLLVKTIPFPPPKTSCGMMWKFQVFPSSHAGHVVLLRLKEDDYPVLPRLNNGQAGPCLYSAGLNRKMQLRGYAHSGWGLEPSEPTKELPNYVRPKMDGIGANEYIVTVTQNVVDFLALEIHLPRGN